MSLTLVWSNEQTEYTIPEQWIDKLDELLQVAGECEEVQSGEVALSFVDDVTIQQLNEQYRGIDEPTDVLSFAMEQFIEEELEISFDEFEGAELSSVPPLLLGDIVISLPRAEEQRTQYGHTLEREIGFLFVHGFLHLLGYDHQDEQSEQEMVSKQEAILQKVGLTR